VSARDEAAPEPDRAPGAPHPRDTKRLIGQGAAEAAFLNAWGSGRPPHGWLLRGPPGVGKATLAYRIARAVLAAPEGATPATLDLDPGHPVARRVSAQSEPRLAVLRRSANPQTKRLRREIAVEDARALKGRLFQLTAADGGWRVAIVDAADDLNRESANALLKILEEPPPRCLMLLVAQAPGRLPPTIRSRCRALDLGPLSPDDLSAAVAQARDGAPETGAPVDAAALAALAGGSPGAALRLLAADGPALYARLARLLGGAPGLDRRALLGVADDAAARGDGDGRFDMTLALTATLLQRLARAGVAGPGPEAAPGEAALARRLCPDAAAARVWAEAASDAETAGARARAVNLDPAATILDIWLRIDAVAARILRRGAASSG
jgi:DNA polymerase-3 subunit delta'